MHFERPVLSTKKQSPITRHGASSAVEIYQLVGVTLSWWEASEDIIMGLFRLLCDPGEPVAMQAFVASPRSVRYRMLRHAMTRYKDWFEPGQVAGVESALRDLDRLASTRNEIAHGHVSEYNGQVDKTVVASGNYLLPSYHENDAIERGFRYTHVPETLKKFTNDVRRSRGVIMDAMVKLAMAEQDRQQIRKTIFVISNQITKSKMPYLEVEEILNDLLRRMMER